MTDILLFLVALGILGTGFFVVARNYLDPVALFTILWFPRIILRPLFLLSGLNVVAHPFLFHQDVEVLAREAMVVFLVGYVAWVCVFVAAARPARRIVSLVPLRTGLEARPKRIAIFILAMTAVTVGSLLYFLEQTGSLARLIYAARHGFFSGRHVFAKLPIIASMFAVLWLVLSLRRGRGVWLSAGVLLTTMVVMLFFGDRGGVIYGFLALLLCYHFSVRRIPRKVAGTIFIGLYAVVFVLGTIRQGIFLAREEGLAAGFAHAAVDESVSSADQISAKLNLKSFDHFLVVLQDYDLDNYRWGEDYLTGLKGIVPRRIWKGKPTNISMGGWFRDTYMPETEGGKPITAAGEWYINFGYLGVLMGFAIGAFFFRVVWEYVRRTEYGPWGTWLYVMCILNVVAWGVPAVNTFMNVLYWGVPTVVFYLWCFPRRRRRVPAETTSRTRSKRGSHGSLARLRPSS